MEVRMPLWMVVVLFLAFVAAIAVEPKSRYAVLLLASVVIAGSLFFSGLADPNALVVFR